MTNMTTVRLPEDLVQAMRTLTDRDGIPASEQIRRALRAFLTAKKVYTPKKEKKR
jgi:Arc/MetJ-type ribon-helix-helix transcriptional regulator